MPATAPITEPDVQSFTRKGQVLQGSILVGADLSYFQGHFPGSPLLPAVAQVRFVQRLVERGLEHAVRLTDFGRVKFTSRVDPGVELGFRIQLDRDGQGASWRLTQGRKDVSTGTLKFAEVVG